MNLPGTPFNVALKCPVCGWQFDLGLRKLGVIDDGHDSDEERGITCCSMCLTNIDFKIDGSDVRVVTPEILASYSPHAQLVVLEGHFMAWYAQQLKRGMTH